MITRLLYPREIEFYQRSPENFLRVENRDDGGVVIRAARDNYSQRRKSMFVRELAAEGFIPDRYQFVTNCDEGSYSGVQWTVDPSWQAPRTETDIAIAAMRHRRGWQFFWGMFGVAVVTFCWLSKI